MGKIIAVANQKGGVGKTTTAVNLAAALGYKKKKTLIIDLDPQGNATSGFGVVKKDVKISAYDILMLLSSAEEGIIETQFQDVSIIPSNIALAGAELEMAQMENRSMNLKLSLSKIKDQYDYIIIDCPPSLGLITVNALTASDSILMPLQPEYYALEGLSQLVSTVRTVKRLYNKNLYIEGILLTMYDGRLNLTIQVVDEIKKFFADKIFKTVIPRNVRLSEAPSFGKPVIYYDKSSRGAKAYMELTAEVINNNK